MGTNPMAAMAVIGREAEIEAIRAFVSDIPRGPTALVLSGEPGIGKTMLWRTGVEEAREQFDSVLTCRGIEGEALLSFAGLSDLLGGSLEQTLPLLLKPRRRALEVALLLVEPGTDSSDAHAVGLALLDLLRALAAQGPVLLALDDAQWLDPASAAVLQIALRRLRDEPIGLLVTVRGGRRASLPLELERSFPEERLSWLALNPLRGAVLRDLVRERLEVELSRTELGRIEDTCGGNPFFALELGRELMHPEGGHAESAGVRVPASLRELLGGRLARLPAETTGVLLHVAALARPTVELVSAAHGDPERVRAALSSAADEDVIELRDSRIRFAHPLLASICYEDAPVWDRRAVHRALADAAKDIEERARHLARAADGPDAEVAAELDAAAAQAAARGATASAAELCEQAAAFTGEDPAGSRRRRLQAANYYRLAGDGERCVRLLECLLVEAPPGPERADVLVVLIRTLRGSTPSLIERVDEALADAAGDDRRCAEILAVRVGVHLWNTDVRAALEDCRAALAKAELVGDGPLLVASIARLGTAEMYAAEITPGVLERGMTLEEQLDLEVEYINSPRYAYARLLMRLGELDRARAILEPMERAAAARGDESTRVMVLWPLSMLEWLAGRWALALAHATAAYELSELTQHPHGRGWVGRAKALIEADLGLVEQARASAAEALAYAASVSNAFFTIETLGTLGRLELALGNVEAAAGHLRDLPARLSSAGMNDPAQSIWGDAIETLIATGESDLARGYLEQLEHNAERLPSPPALAVALRCRGLLAAADGGPAAGVAVLEPASAGQAAGRWPLEHARTLLCLGSLRRQALRRSEAREPLERALVIFEQLGAPLWAEKARAELRRTGGRQPQADGLTETEVQVAVLAARGRSNKEIAAELFMGLSTVEMHLSRVYRKLEIRSRAGLGPWLATRAEEPAET
jgi:DNA-binding CsgD family transcriptional regulator